MEGSSFRRKICLKANWQWPRGRRLIRENRAALLRNLKDPGPGVVIEGQSSTTRMDGGVDDGHRQRSVNDDHDGPDSR